MRGRVEGAQRFGGFEHAAIARVAGRRGEMLGAITRANDAVGLQQRIGQRDDDLVLRGALVGSGGRIDEVAREGDGVLGGIDQLENAVWWRSRRIRASRSGDSRAAAAPRRPRRPRRSPGWPLPAPL
jgi:hypothetical protein